LPGVADELRRRDQSETAKVVGLMISFSLLLGARRLLRCMSLDLAHRVDIGMSAFAPLLGAKRT
jgi:hypothetical protein